MKNLVLYFSVYGTAKIVAKEIAKQTGADIVEIEPAVPYDSNRDHYNALAAYAKKEHDEDQRPAIKNDIDISGYDNIFIGFPVWWYDLPMSMWTFLESYDLSGKTIIPFFSHEGSSNGASALPTIETLATGATVRSGDALSIRGGNVDGAENEVREWVRGLGLD